MRGGLSGSTSAVNSSLATTGAKRLSSVSPCASRSTRRLSSLVMVACVTFDADAGAAPSASLASSSCTGIVPSTSLTGPVSTAVAAAASVLIASAVEPEGRHFTWTICTSAPDKASAAAASAGLGLPSVVAGTVDVASDAGL